MSTARVWRVTGTVPYSLDFDETVIAHDVGSAAEALRLRMAREDRLRLPAGFKRMPAVYTKIEPEPET